MSGTFGFLGAFFLASTAFEGFPIPKEGAPGSPGIPGRLGSPMDGKLVPESEGGGGKLLPESEGGGGKLLPESEGGGGS